MISVTVLRARIIELEKQVEKLQRKEEQLTEYCQYLDKRLIELERAAGE